MAGTTFEESTKALYEMAYNDAKTHGKEKELNELDSIAKDKKIFSQPKYTDDIINKNLDSYEDFEDDDPSIAYDVIPLPSKGLCYKNKKSTIKVAYLTAADEDIITSPNLYRDNKIVDIILKRKILDKSFNIDEMLQGDVDAILLWLRATGYGTDYPIVVTPENEDIEPFNATVDLSEIKIKDIDIKPDDDGLFNFVLPSSNAIVKFKFLTYKEDEMLRKEYNSSEMLTKKIDIESMSNNINNMISLDASMSPMLKKNLTQLVLSLNQWANTIDVSNTSSYSKSVTKRMKMLIVEVNGNRDRAFIENFIKNMRSIDAYEFRKYVAEHTPGLDLVVNVKSPGGDSISTFLQIDPSILLVNA